MIAFTHLHQFDGQGSFLNWLYRIAHRECCRRILERRNQAVPLEDHLDALALLVDPIPARTEQLDLERAPDTLPDSLSDPFLLVKAEERRYRDVGDILAIPEGTVKYRVHQAGERLRAVLFDDENASSPPPCTLERKRARSGELAGSTKGGSYCPFTVAPVDAFADRELSWLASWRFSGHLRDCCACFRACLEARQLRVVLAEWDNVLSPHALWGRARPALLRSQEFAPSTASPKSGSAR